MSASRPGALGPWDFFVLRHHKPGNLALHFVSAVLFFGSPAYGAVTGDPMWFVIFCASGCLGTWSHYLFRDGTVSWHQATSSPRVVTYNVRMWWRILTGRYGADVAAARRRLAQEQTQLGRTALITGCSSGFGEAAMRALLERGWFVIATVRDRTRAPQIDGADAARLTVLEVDVTDPAARARLLEHLSERPRLDCLVNNAGQGVFGALEDLEESDLRAQLEVSFFASALLARDCVPLLRKSGGALIQVSSPAGVAAFPFTGAYCASKHAIEGLMESLRHELAVSASGAPPVRVHLLTPSGHATRFFASARWRIAERGPHAAGAHAYRAVMERSHAGRLPAARRVGEVIAELAERVGSPFRVDVGPNVRVLRALVRWLPAFIRHALVVRVFRRAAETAPPRAEVRAR